MAKTDTYEIKIGEEDAYRVLKADAAHLALQPGRLRTVIARSQNDAMGQAKNFIVKEIRAIYAIPASEVKTTMRVQKAHKGSLSASISLRGPMSLPLSRFGPKKRGSGKKAGWYVRVLATSKAKLISKDGIKGFSHNTMFMREGKDRLPIKKLFGPGFVSLLNAKDRSEKIEKFTSEAFERRLLANADRALGSGGGK